MERRVENKNGWVGQFSWLILYSTPAGFLQDLRHSMTKLTLTHTKIGSESLLAVLKEGGGYNKP